MYNIISHRGRATRTSCTPFVYSSCIRWLSHHKFFKCTTILETRRSHDIESDLHTWPHYRTFVSFNCSSYIAVMHGQVWLWNNLLAYYGALPPILKEMGHTVNKHVTFDEKIFLYLSAVPWPFINYWQDGSLNISRQCCRRSSRKLNIFFIEKQLHQKKTKIKGGTALFLFA